MTWTEERLASLPVKRDIRQRGEDMTRLETFCDAAFAFAVTLLVISGDTIPTSYADLLAALKDIPAFAGSYAAIVYLWVSHRRWSHCYGLEDRATTAISLAMVFVMLVYVYPLKMVASAFASYVSRGWLPSSFQMRSGTDLTGLFVIYGLGFAAQAAMLAALHVRALKATAILNLSPVERLRTRQAVVTHTVLAVTGLASALFAAVMPLSIGVFAGFVYLTLPATMPVVAIRHERQVAQLTAAPGKARSDMQ
jgi:uncharacterized membrane protein